MKFNKIIILAAFFLMLTSCDNFEEINTDPNAATPEQVMPEYFLNQSILGAQMNPDTAERAFVLYWKTAGRQQGDNGSFSTGDYSDGWSSNYWNDLSRWLKSANLAISVGEEKAENGTATEYNNNIIQAARIWRAYLLSELADNWGPAPLDGFQGVNPSFSSVKDVYYYMLDELKDAVSKMDVSIVVAEEKTKNIDIAYQMDWENWVRYANSMRMRLAMRLSEVDAAKAQSEFEDAVATNMYIEEADQNFDVVEQAGWDGLTGVMSRPWNQQILSETMNNLMIGLGGVSSTDQLPSYLDTHVKPADYIGLKFADQYPTKINDPYVGYFFDGLHNTIDPRAYKLFYIPGDVQGGLIPESFIVDDSEMERKMKYADGSEVLVNTKYTWSTYPLGEWGTAEALNEVAGYAQFAPSLVKGYRNSSSERIFFASWESYFLIAEAAVRGWTVPMAAEAAYNRGIEDSFAYNGVSSFYGDYISSTDYNRLGTSVSFSHTVEPPASYTMNYTDGKTGQSGTVTINYPDNTLYQNGTVKNDQLTKIITQKFIANMPWLPLESWNDHRRLGLPFFENPAVEKPIPNLPALNSSNYNTSSVEFLPQRLPYPSGFRNNDPEGYQKAVQLLDGADKVLTPLWWAQH